MNKLKKVITFSVIFLIIAFLINKAIRSHFFNNISFFFSVENIYIFNFFLSFIVVATIVFIHSKFPNKAGYTFLGFSVLKIVFSVIYLYPLIDSNFENKIPDVLNFFLCYFLFLLVESIIVVSLLKED